MATINELAKKLRYFYVSVPIKASPGDRIVVLGEVCIGVESIPEEVEEAPRRRSPSSRVPDPAELEDRIMSIMNDNTSKWVNSAFICKKLRIEKKDTVKRLAVSRAMIRLVKCEKIEKDGTRAGSTYRLVLEKAK